MADISLSFSTENGISLDDLVGIFTGTVDPSVTGEAAPIGSIFIRQDGSLYQKITAADTGWIKFAQGLGEAVKIRATDTTPGYLNDKLVTSSLSKTLGNQGSNEYISLDLSAIGTPGTYKSVTTDAYGRVTAGTNPTTLSGYGITDAQPLDSTLTALAAYNTAGLLTQTAADTFVGRTLTGTANQITVTNGNGVAGNPTVSFPSTILFPGTTGIRPPSGTTAQRVATASYLRYNTDLAALEYYNGTTWVQLVASTGGTVTSVGAVQPSQGLTISGSPITTSGSLTFTLANDLAGIEGLTGTGFSVRTGTDTWTTRTLSGVTDRISVSNGDGVTAAPVIDIASTYTGQSSITTVGIISSGTWQGTTLSTQFGGTGRTSIGSANQVLGVNTSGTGLEYKTIIGSTGLNVSLTAGTISLTNTGVTSITGTASQVITSGSTGAITLSLPQNIGTTSSPTFASVSVAADPVSDLQLATKRYVDNAVQGLSPKTSVRVATTGNITLSGLQTIDGVDLVQGDRVLVKSQTALAENGIYVASSGTWARAADMDTWAEVPGALVVVQQGASEADTAWLSTADTGGALGTTPVTWTQFLSATDISAGTGLIRTGNMISLTSTGVSPGTYNTITVDAQGRATAASNTPYLTGNQVITLQGSVLGSGTTLINTTLSSTGVTAGTYKSVSVNADGRVTAGTNPTTLAGYGITDAQPLSTLLTNVSNLSTDGIIVKSGSSSLTRAIQAGSTKVSITNGNGIAGNPTVDVIESNLTLTNLGGTLSLAKGGTGLTAGGAVNQLLGMNATGTGLEYKTIAAGTGITVTQTAGNITISSQNTGTVTSVAASSASSGLVISGSPITSSGTLAFSLNSEIQGLTTLTGSTGLVVHTANGGYAQRSVVSGNGTITITNPAGLAGNIGVELTTTGTAGTYKSVTTDVYGRVTAGTNPTTLAGYGITDAVSTSQIGVPGGVASLDGTGKLPVSQLPATAIVNTNVVASQSAMLALTAQVGDIAVRTDLNKTYILAAEPASTLGNWQELLTSTAPVTSVNGQTGAVNVGTVTSVAATAGTGLTVTGSPITTTGTLSFALANDIAAVEALSGIGLAVRTGAESWATRTLVAGTGISITNPAGTAGDITIANTGVTSVGMTVPSFLLVAGSPITSTGTFAISLAPQAAKTVFAAPSTGAGTPTFRTIALGTDLSDVTISSPSTNQVLSYDGTKWVNSGAVGASASGLIGAGQTGGAAWTLLAGSRYYADFAHGLGTTNVVVTVYDTSNNAVVQPDSIVLTSTTTIRITVLGNTKTLRVVVVANGQSIVANGSTPSSIITAKEGVTVTTATTKLNFIGQNVSVTDAGSGTTNVSFGQRFVYFASSMDSPVSDYAVNSLAPAIPDPSFPSLMVRSFSNTTEQGVGLLVSIPTGCTTITFKMKGRAGVNPGTTGYIVQPRIYTRGLLDNAATSSWSGAHELANITINNNQYFQYVTQTYSLSTLGMTAGTTYQVELTRRISGVSGGTQLAGAWYLMELTVEVS